MNYAAYQFWGGIIVFIFSSAAWLYVWRSKSDKETEQKIMQIEQQMSRHINDNSEQLARIEERLSHVRGSDELHPIYERMNTIDKNISRMDGRMHTLDLIHEMLLHGEKK